MVTETVIAKLLGSFSGAVLALIFLPPKTLAGFFRRSSFSLASGALFSPIAMEQFKWIDTFDHWTAAATICSFLSWWLTGAVIAAARKWFGEKTAPEQD